MNYLEVPLIFGSIRGDMSPAARACFGVRRIPVLGGTCSGAAGGVERLRVGSVRCCPFVNQNKVIPFPTLPDDIV